MKEESLENTAAARRLADEAQAFDRQILERVAAGHIPDLRRAAECRYFYNNSWRHPHYVRLDFGEQCELILGAINAHAPKTAGTARILEVGCGPGHISLELARNRLQVTGVDLSRVCVEIAERFAAEDPWQAERGALHYLAGDFFDEGLLPARSFDAVVFVGALHHFPDQARVGTRVGSLLVDDGIIVVHEPTRDRMTRGNAAFIHLVRVLLSVGGGYYQQIPIPESRPEQVEAIEKIFRAMRYESESGGNLQSVNDNEAGFVEMCALLDAGFDRVHFQERYAFFHELIGGLRFADELNGRLARYLRDMDREMCKAGVLQPTEFFYVGRKRGGG